MDDVVFPIQRVLKAIGKTEEKFCIGENLILIPDKIRNAESEILPIICTEKEKEMVKETVTPDGIIWKKSTREREQIC